MRYQGPYPAEDPDIALQLLHKRRLSQTPSFRLSPSRAFPVLTAFWSEVCPGFALSTVTEGALDFAENGTCHLFGKVKQKVADGFEACVWLLSRLYAAG
jgi:hypothetical protein